MNNVSICDGVSLPSDLAHTLSEYTSNIEQRLGYASAHLLGVGQLLADCRKEIFAAEYASGFKAYCENTLNLSFGYAYKLIKAWDTYGKDIDRASQVSTSVLLVLMKGDDPQALLEEAIQKKKEKGKVSVKDAQEMAKKAADIIERGEVENYVPVSVEAQQEAVEAIKESIEANLSTTGQCVEAGDQSSLSRARRITRAKRVLTTVIDLLAEQLARADLSQSDVGDAVAEMLLSPDQNEVEAIEQLREFCAVICSPIIKETNNG